MKKLSLLLSLILALSVFASCSKTEPDVPVDSVKPVETEDWRTAELLEKRRELGADLDAPVKTFHPAKTYDYANKRYTCKTGGEIGVVDLSDNSYTKLTTIEGASVLFVDEDGIYVTCNSPFKMIALDLSGNIIKEIKLADSTQS